MLVLLLFSLPFLAASLLRLFIIVSFFGKKLTDFTAGQKFSLFSGLFFFVSSSVCFAYALVVMAYRAITIVFIGPS